MFDKRQSERSAIEMAASYGISEDPRPQREAKIKNISLGGLCLTLDKQVAVGENIQLAIELDSKNDATVYARVVWVKKDEETQKYTIGVQFVEKEGSDYEQFMEYCDALT